jgi:hypothetical protein
VIQTAPSLISNANGRHGPVRGAGPAIILSLLLTQLCLSTEQARLLPQWLLKAIEAERKLPHPGSFEEATYEGKRVFELTRSDRFDTGDEHTLFSENGKEICKFGGFAGHVTSGVCDTGKIIYVRTF